MAAQRVDHALLKGAMRQRGSVVPPVKVQKNIKVNFEDY